MIKKSVSLSTNLRCCTSYITGNSFCVNAKIFFEKSMYSLAVAVSAIACASTAAAIIESCCAASSESWFITTVSCNGTSCALTQMRVTSININNSFFISKNNSRTQSVSCYSGSSTFHRSVFLQHKPRQIYQL
jgi:hypothetical protein